MKIMLALTLVEGFISSMQFLVFASLAACGFLFVAFALFFGHHGEDMDHGIEHDGGHGMDGHESIPSFFSPRILFAFMLGFGATGAIATAYGATAAIACAIGAVPGILIAVVVWLMAVALYKQQVNSGMKPGQVMGATGTVVSTIPEHGIGEVNLHVNGQILPFSANSRNNARIRIGTIVRVIRVVGTTVTVEESAAAS